MRHIKEIDIAGVLATFTIINRKLYRKRKDGSWKPVIIKLSNKGRGSVRFNGKPIILSRLLFIIHHGRDVEAGLLIDHIDNNPWNNSVENLQELNSRDNGSKDRVYNPLADHASDRVRFRVQDSTGKQIRFHIGCYHDDDIRETVWLSLAPLFLFRQELKGFQKPRERLLSLVDLGDIDAAKALVRAYALVNGIEI